MNVAIIGSRDFSDYDHLHEVMDRIMMECGGNFDLVISGGARGADTLGEKWAKGHGIKTKIFYPNWDKYGRQAGYLRNIDIIQNSDIVVAFWDGKSRGTKHSMDLTEKHNKKLIVDRYNV